jgi:ribosomal-protein-alanine N-acetyltransferase
VGLPLVTERLELRAFEPDNLEALHAIYGDPEVTRFMPAYPTLEHTRRALDIHVREARAGNPAFWALIERESGDLIGDAGIGLIEGIGPEFELGYTLGPRWWGRGYATEAARAVRDYALGPLALPEVLALGAAGERGLDQRAREDRDGASGNAQRLRGRAPGLLDRERALHAGGLVACL